MSAIFDHSLTRKKEKLNYHLMYCLNDLKEKIIPKKEPLVDQAQIFFKKKSYFIKKTSQDNVYNLNSI